MKGVVMTKTINENSILFKGKDGKKAVKQILKALPVCNKYTKSFSERAKAFEKRMYTSEV
jgi:hypothetical protein